jgi:hypothetical protein
MMKSFAPKSVPMSVFVPHIDSAFSWDDIVYHFEHTFEIGKLERIEAVPKINQKDGHPYHACFLYFSHWGNGFNAQNLRLRIMQNMQTRFYVTDRLYWVVCPNTSDVYIENLPMPKHMSLTMFVSGNNDLDTIIQTFNEMELGKVSTIHTRYLDQNPIQQNLIVYNHISCHGSNIPWIQIMNPHAWKIIVEFDYWYHSKSAYEFQKMLASENYVILFPNISTRWVVTNSLENPRTDGINPYIWNASISLPTSSHSAIQERDIEWGMDDVSVPPTSLPNPPDLRSVCLSKFASDDEPDPAIMALYLYSENCSIANIV